MIYRDKELELFSLPIASFDERVAARKEAISLDLDMADSLLFAKGSFWQTDSTAAWIYQAFNQASEMVYLGEGGFSAPMTDRSILYDGPLVSKDSLATILSVWMFIDRDLYTRTRVRIEEYQPDTGEIVSVFEEDARKLVQVFDNNGWALLELSYQLQQPDHHIRWSFQNERLKQQSLYLDELFIRPAGVDVYRRGEGWVWKNNRHYY